jgi:sec-independent protein translocase protein TatC
LEIRFIALHWASTPHRLPAIPVAIIPFIGEMAFAFSVPTGLSSSSLYGSNHLKPSSYFNFGNMIMFWIVTFEFPLVIYLMASLGFVKAKTLTSQWRLAIVIIGVMAAGITPTVDPINMGLVMAPMIVLYFISIGLAHIAERGRANKQQEEALKDI